MTPGQIMRRVLRCFKPVRIDHHPLHGAGDADVDLPCVVLTQLSEFFFGEQRISLCSKKVVTAEDKDHRPLQACGGHEVCHPDADHRRGIITHGGGCA